MATYNEAAREIIKDAIKSAIFIDENAKEPYTIGEPSEAERTKNLYEHFRKDGISLDVWQYTSKKYKSVQNYIFNNRDLVLLDWKLEGQGKSGEKALNILSDIILKYKQTHFCAIYTEDKKEDVFNNILSYFSSGTTAEYVDIRTDLAEYEEDIQKIATQLIGLSWWRFNKNKRAEILKPLYAERNELIQEIQKYFREQHFNKDSLCSLIKTGIAFSSFSTSKISLPCPISINPDTYTLCIFNTFITVINKTETNPQNLFKIFEENICDYDHGVMQLIGLEFRNKQRSNGNLIDNLVLSVTPETLGYHKSTSDEFGDFVKTIMLEQEALNFRQEKLSIVESIEEKEYDDRLADEYAALNVFYNSVILDGDKKVLSFGDVFKYGEHYYMCITALCDCAEPSKRRNQYYFATGDNISPEKALKIGDEGFVSFLSKDVCVKWNHSTAIEEDFPSYIVPEIYLVPKNIIKNKVLTVLQYVVEGNKIKKEKKSFEYITTIKQNYAQRIANHAFSHPIRVGIDFVKKPQNM